MENRFRKEDMSRLVEEELARRREIDKNKAELRHRHHPMVVGLLKELANNMEWNEDVEIKGEGVQRDQADWKLIFNHTKRSRLYNLGIIFFEETGPRPCMGHTMPPRHQLFAANFHHTPYHRKEHNDFFHKSTGDISEEGLISILQSAAKAFITNS